jgi:hypothetical protein
MGICRLLCRVADVRRDRHRQKLAGVLPRKIGDGDELPLLPQDALGKARNVGHVDAAAHHACAFLHRAQGGRHERSDRRENDGGIERFRRHLVGAPPRPRRASVRNSARLRRRRG